eukprot:8575024-Pyramimonas_sp.AAC.1
MSDPLAARRRWLEHFTDVLGGAPISEAELRELERPPRSAPSALDVGPEATRIAFKALGRNK